MLFCFFGCHRKTFKDINQSPFKVSIRNRPRSVPLYILYTQLRARSRSSDIDLFPPPFFFSFLLHHRIIDGVRKWMGSPTTPVRQDSVATERSRAPDVPRETERLDPTDTGVMATRHLAPFVSKEEEGEYERSEKHVLTPIFLLLFSLTIHPPPISTVSLFFFLGWV